MNATLAPLLDYWQQRNSREKLILLLGGAVLAIALIYALLIEPVATSRTRLEKSLPALRADMARFQRDLAQATGKTQATSKPDMASLLASAGLPASALKQQGDKQASLQAQGMAWPALTKLLADAQAQGWSLKQLQVRGGEASGMVDATVEWQR